MGLARELAELERSLREAGSELFAVSEAGGLMDSVEFGAISQRLDERGFSEPERVARLCLQALRVQYCELSPRLLDTEFVATLPPEVPGIARPTDRVIGEMLAGDPREIILVGYDVTDDALVGLLARSASSGADVIMICDRQRGGADRVLAAWPHDIDPPSIFVDCERSGAPYASMHAKCLLVDSDDLLITSANFTFHGLHGNIEIGVRLHGPPAAEARKIFSYLVDEGLVTDAGSGHA